MHKGTWEESRIHKKKQILTKKLTTLMRDEQTKKTETVARALFLAGMSAERAPIKMEKYLYQRELSEEERLQRGVAVRKGKKEFRRGQVVLD